MWFSVRHFVKLKLKLLNIEQLTELRRDITAALILTTEETEKRYRSALEHSAALREIEEARTSLAQRADYLQATASFLWADFLWPDLPPPAKAETASRVGTPEQVTPPIVR